MWSPQTIGDEWPRPGTGTFHFTPRSADHLSVYLPVLTMPWPDGPRQRVQYFAASPSTSIIDTVSTAESAATAAGDSGERSECGAFSCDNLSSTGESTRSEMRAWVSFAHGKAVVGVVARIVANRTALNT